MFHILALVQIVLVLELGFVRHLQMSPHPLLGVGHGAAELTVEHLLPLQADFVLLAQVGVQAGREIEAPKRNKEMFDFLFYFRAIFDTVSR